MGGLLKSKPALCLVVQIGHGALPCAVVSMTQLDLTCCLPHLGHSRLQAVLCSGWLFLR